MKNALILGASSGVGRELGELLAKDGWNLVLCSRNVRDLNANVADFSLKYGIDAQTLEIDINEKNQRDELILYITKRKDINDFFITIGEICENDNGLQHHEISDRLVNTNFLSIIYFISALLQSLHNNEKIQLFLLSSIAVSRPRKSNLIYATSKAALDFYCRGLQHLFVSMPVKIIVIRLGYIDTEMSFGKKLLLPAVPATHAANFILSKIKKRKRIYYYPGYWKYITFLI
jgi:short-subunit dehydrogenase